MATKNDNKDKEVLENDRQPVDVSGTDATQESEKERKTSPQDRTEFADNDHVQYNLDVDPNDPRNREPAKPGVSLDELDAKSEDKK